MSTDITHVLRRQAVREVMDELDKDLDWFADQIGFHVLTTRVWLGRIITDARHIDRAVDRFLSSHEDARVKVRRPEPKQRGRKPGTAQYVPGVCSRCKQYAADRYSSGYCRSCAREYNRERLRAKRAVTA